MLNASMFSSEKNDWPTPQYVFDKLNAEFSFDLDPCCSPDTAKCAKFFTEIDNGLVQEWTGNVFMNPPYGRGIAQWMQKAYDSCVVNNATVVCLVPARVDTKWWHAYAMRSSEIRFTTRRLTFDGANNKAPFPVAIVIFRPGQYLPILGSIET